MPRAAASSNAIRDRSRRSTCVRTCMYVCKVTDMRLPATAHTSKPWRIHEIAYDFRLEDVWALPTPGGADDFPLLLARVAGSDPGQESSLPARVLWAARWKLGEIFGWDDPDEASGGGGAPPNEGLPHA